MITADFPEYYFKFLSFGEHTIDTLENLIDGNLYTPLIDQLNDPFEGLWHDNHLHSKYPGEDMEFRDSLIRRRVYCLCSNDSEEFPFKPESITMWSHYADSHKGFCVMFSKDILKTKGQEQFSPRKIEYTDSLAERTGNQERDLTILFKKSDVWNSEKEVRLCFRAKDKKGDDILYRQVPKGCILAIFAGCRISILNDSLLHGICKKLGCDYHRLILSNHFYSFAEDQDSCDG